MHELAIMETILEKTVDFAAKHNAHKIVTINLTLGGFSGIVPEYAGQFFQMIAQGTIAEEAKLVFEHVPGRFICRDCKQETKVDRVTSQTIVCGVCGSENVQLIGGREFAIKSLEVV